MTGDELVEEIDPDEHVRGIITRSQMRARNVWHRCTYIVVRNDTSHVLVHQRAPWKDLWPSRWDVAFGGVCGVGESFADAAARELAEEAGVGGVLSLAGSVRYEGPLTRVVGRLYTITHAGPFSFPDGEVVDHAWVAPTELQEWLYDRELCDDSLAVIVPFLIREDSCA